MKSDGAAPASADQLSFFGSGEGRMAPPVRASAPHPEQVRARLAELLDTLRRAEVLPWTQREARLWRTTFPQMTRWLPEDEAEALRQEFLRECQRLSPAEPAGADAR